jgi:hypothetical protein
LRKKEGRKEGKGFLGLLVFDLEKGFVKEGCRPQEGLVFQGKGREEEKGF